MEFICANNERARDFAELIFQTEMWGLSYPVLLTGRGRGKNKKNVFLVKNNVFFVKNPEFHHLKSQKCSS